MPFGQSSERLIQVIEQLELRLEDLETLEGAEISATMFIDRHLPQLGRHATIIATCAACELFWYAVYGLSGKTVAASCGSRVGTRCLTGSQVAYSLVRGGNAGS